jgi:hypothetical protein
MPILSTRSRDPDRAHARGHVLCAPTIGVQVFKEDGTFVKNAFVRKTRSDRGSVMTDGAIRAQCGLAR